VSELGDYGGGSEYKYYDGGVRFGEPTGFQPVIRPAVPSCQCRHTLFTLYRGHRADGSCIRCGGAT